jgi:uncharacterized membrane protein YciS (DUF1049 family)
MQILTPEEFKSALPVQFKKNVNQQLIDSINSVISDPEIYEAYRDNLVGFSHVLQQGKFRLDNYVEAVRYVSFKLMGLTNKAAYAKTFPEKIKRFNLLMVADKDVASYCTAYNKSKLVSLIYEQSLIPSWVLNQDLHQKALNVQAELMMTAKSEKVRSDAANSLLTHLKQPETQKIQLDIGVAENGAINALRAQTLELVAQQKQMLQAGMVSSEEVAHKRLINDVEYQEID